MLGAPLTRAADALLGRLPTLGAGNCGRTASRPSAHRQKSHAASAVRSACTCMAPQTPLHVAVIGAGAAGLIAARELLREGHDVTVYEQISDLGGVWVYPEQTEQAVLGCGNKCGSDVGGVWVYTEQTEDDVLGIRPDRRRVHSSMYKTLRTNLPREVMAFTDFPFLPAAMRRAGVPSTDDRQFPSHEEVYAYLKAFAAAFQLDRRVRFNTQVIQALPVDAAANGSAVTAAGDAVSEGNGAASASSTIRHRERWQVSTAPAATHSSDESRLATQTFDALVVCNGHFSEPRLPDAPGADVFPGRQMHSHNYREAGPFAGQRVVVVGAAASGGDIGREIAETASQVWLSARQWSPGTPPLGPRRNITAVPTFEGLAADGSVRFAQGQAAERVDVVVYATGYIYTFPFLKDANVITVEDNRVGPLYQHIWPPAHSPSLSFVGLPWKVVPFPQYELQSRWIARVLSGRVQLPSTEDMQAHAEGFYRQLQEQGIEQRFTHRLDGDLQWEHNDWLARQCGPDVPASAPWRPTLYQEASSNRRRVPDGYRDLSLDATAVEQAHQEAATVQGITCAA